MSDYLTYALAKEHQQRLMEDASTAKLARAARRAARETGQRGIRAALVARIRGIRHAVPSNRGADVVRIDRPRLEDAA